jgi:hypothetical protein
MKSVPSWNSIFPFPLCHFNWQMSFTVPIRLRSSCTRLDFVLQWHSLIWSCNLSVSPQNQFPSSFKAHKMPELDESFHLIRRCQGKKVKNPVISSLYGPKPTIFAEYGIHSQHSFTKSVRIYFQLYLGQSKSSCGGTVFSYKKL